VLPKYRFLDPPRLPTTLVDLLRERAECQADDRAYTFLVDGESEEAHLGKQTTPPALTPTPNKQQHQHHQLNAAFPLYRSDHNSPH
jgi:hypothetical protein